MDMDHGEDSAPAGFDAGRRVSEAWSNRFNRMVSSTTIMLVLTTAWAVLRIVSRRMAKRKFQTEDYIYFVAQLFFYGSAACSLTLIATGPPNRATMPIKMRTMMPMRLCYAMTLFCVKLSIILIIRRIFAQSSRSVRILCWVALALTALWALYASLIEFLICTPVESAWDPTVPRTRCIDHRLAYGVIPAWDIPIELLILAIPLPSILRLQTAKVQKVALVAMFSAGFVTILFSAIYLYFTIVNFHISYMISIIHSGIALMVASSTALHHLFNRIILPWFRTVARSGIHSGAGQGLETNRQSGVALQDILGSPKPRPRTESIAESERQLAPQTQDLDGRPRSKQSRNLTPISDELRTSWTNTDISQPGG
ncbi:hypothetical protein B0I35DRAFT_479569 [Stachybotrys elegans]|uniref:Rhodopsin domain-containing protein n=1 Tax=Stachybotrys elegans TaxID=80388 RepID=A0A8K0SUT0_9HYPO|nr:hypothetical protein B0I35DRAFT_479569 [Stachybotrys elegans]